MNIVKVSNLMNNCNADYKGLDLSLIQSGTQIYPDNSNEAYFYYDGDVPTNADLTIIDQATYNTIKQQQMPNPNIPTIESRLASVESAITALMGV